MRKSASKNAWLVVAGSLIVLGTASPIGLAGAGADRAAKSAAFVGLAPVVVTSVSPRMSPIRLEGLRTLGADALIVDRTVSPAKRSQLIAFARRAKLRVFEPMRQPDANASTTSLRNACLAPRFAVDRCAVEAQSPADAANLIAAGTVDLVVLPVASPDAYLHLPTNRSRRTRLVAIVPLTTATFGTPWLRAVHRSLQVPGTTLAVSPDDLDSPSLDAYLRLVHSIHGTLGSVPFGAANLWVDQNGGTCRRSSSGTAFDDARACGSFNAAYRAARPGDLILVKAGAYGSQTIANRADLPIGSRTVVFQPALDQSATFDGGLTIDSHDVIVNGSDEIGIDGVNRFSVLNGGIAICYGTGSDDWCGGGALPGVGDRNSAFENVNTESAFFNAWGSTVAYSNIGPLNVCDNRSDDLVKGWWVGQDETNPIHDLHIEYNLIHDNEKIGCDSDAHNDAIQFEGTGTIIRGNRIWNCGTQCIFEGAGNNGNLIENNMVEETNSCGPCADSTEISSADPNVIVRYNTLDGAMRFYNPNRPSAHAIVYGNIFLNQRFCDAASTYTYNVFARGVSCGTHAVSCTPLLASGSLWTNTDMHADFHLSPKDRCARGAGDQSRYPGFDLDGQRRPIGQADAGADEVP